MNLAPPDWVHAESFGAIKHYDYTVDDTDGEVIFFYGGVFSNFYPSMIIMPHPWRETETVYETVEHWYQANKATNEFDHEFVRTAHDAALSKSRGQKIELVDNWDVDKFDIMLAGVRQKFKNVFLRRELLNTGERYIAEDSPSDFIWGLWNPRTGRYNGMNLLGECLMRVREEIQHSLEQIRIESTTKQGA